MESVKSNLKSEKSEYNKTHKKEIEIEKTKRKEKYGYFLEKRSSR